MVSNISYLVQAVAAAASLVDSKLGKELKKFLKKNIVKKELTDDLGVADTKLGGIIKDKLGVQCIADSAVMELQRGIRSQLTSLVEGLDEDQLRAMQLGLSHTLSRYKLKFSPDKVRLESPLQGCRLLPTAIARPRRSTQ